MRNKYRQLRQKDREDLELLLRAGHSKKECAQLLGVHVSTIYRELRRGECMQRDYHYREYRAYSAIVAQDRYNDLVFHKGAPLKIGKCRALSDYIEDKIINKKFSPAAVSADLRDSALPYLCEATIYRYIDQGLFINLERQHLPEHGRRKHPYKQVVHKNKRRLGTSIEKRPAVVAERKSFGHWEMDSVVGRKNGRGESVLVLTERLTRFELILKVRDKTAVSTVNALDRLQSICGFSRLFKTITCDNGSEFADSLRIEHSAAGRRRTHAYFCHPYTSCERGSNENANRMFRRWYPKGKSLKAVTQSECRRLSAWMNCYPREVLGWKTASQAFLAACECEGIKISKEFSQYLC